MIRYSITNEISLAKGIHDTIEVYRRQALLTLGFRINTPDLIIIIYIPFIFQSTYKQNLVSNNYPIYPVSKATSTINTIILLYGTVKNNKRTSVSPQRSVLSHDRTYSFFFAISKTTKEVRVII